MMGSQNKQLLYLSSFFWNEHCDNHSDDDAAANDDDGGHTIVELGSFSLV